ncbi:MAG: photosynthetic complex assembly protein PuhC [Pseudomonadota bacterium]
MSDHDHGQVPRIPLLSAGALVAVALVGVAVVRLAGLGPDGSPPDSPVLAERSLYFTDTAAGIVLVTVADGRVLDRLEVGSAGFLRATLRGLARDRQPLGAGAERPFLIQRLANGQLLLTDPTTGRHVDLLAFGPTNAAAFSRYLTAAPTLVATTKESEL